MTNEDTLTLDENETTHLPIVDILTGRGAILGKSGSGKSNTASVIAEELLDRGFPLLIVDTDGEYWGLKETYELLHVGADEECDLQVGPEHAEKLAELALEQNVPIILDVSGYLDADSASSLVRETTAALFNKEKRLNKPFLLLVEEIHEYIPEGKGLDTTGEWLIRVAKRGRKRGLGLCGISQRPANVKKDFLTQADWIAWHRLTWENDTKVVRRVVGKGSDNRVQELNDGEALLMADFVDEDLIEVQARRKDTFDAGATPDLGEFERPELKSVGSDLVSELEEITQSEQDRRDRVAELEARLEQKQTRIDDLEEELENARDMSDMAQQFTEALTASKGEGGEVLEEKLNEIREEKNTEIRELRAEKSTLEDQFVSVKEDAQILRERVEELEEYEQAVENMDELREAVVRMNEALGVKIDGADEKLRERVKHQSDQINEYESKLEELQEQLNNVGEPVVPSDYEKFIDDEVVREAIEDAKTAEHVSPRYVKGVCATLLQEGEPTDYETIAEYLGISDTSNIGKAVSALEARGVVKRVESRPVVVDFDVDAIEEIKAMQRRREQAESIMETL